MQTTIARLLPAILLAVSPLVAAPSFAPVDSFELDRYLGTWYEIARFPHWFEEGQTHVTATYSKRPDGKLKIENKGLKGGKESVSEGKGKMGGAPDQGYLRVSFFLMFYADYVIVDLDTNYQYALVAGAPNKYLWILARSSTIPDNVRDRLVTKAKELGFDTKKLYFTPQTESPASE